MPPDGARDRATPALRGSELIARIADELQPIVDRFFAGRDALTLSRQSLAIEVGQAVTTVLDGRKIPLNLLERRNLIALLMSNLLSAASARAGAPATASTIDDVEAAVQDTLAADPGPSHPRLAAAIPVAEPTPASVSTHSVSPALAPKIPDRKSSAGRAHIEIAKDQIQAIVVERIDLAAAVKLERVELGRQVGQIAQEVLAEQKIRLNQREQRDLTELLLDDMLGLGPLEPLLADETVTDIMVNGPNQVYVERGGKLVVTDVKFRNNQHVMNVATRIVSQIGRRVDESVPLCDARLMDGSRVNIIIPPLAIDGPSISIRKFSKKGITLDVMARQRNISEALATVLKIAARTKLNILISGGTGSGKTTLLNAMSQMIDNGDRIVTIEDAAELQLQQPHVVRLETRPANLEGEGEITMRDLVKNALRMRPDRIILGEVRGSEAIDMLQAMNTGHEGSMSTIHANRPREALTRLENMVGMAGINLPAKAVRTQVSAAIDIIVQISRMRDGMRRVTHVIEVVGMEGDVIITQDLFTYEFEGEEPDGKLRGQFKSSGLRPHFTPKAAYFGLDRALLEVM
jgi:pilus assembly protein CpaF